MPTLPEHVDQVDRNQKARKHLDAWGQTPEWVVTVAFYEALHLLEAYWAYAGDLGKAHTDHNTRNDLVRSDPRLRAVAVEYKKLFDASIWARYIKGTGALSSGRSTGVKTQATDSWLFKIRQFVQANGVSA